MSLRKILAYSMGLSSCFILSIFINFNHSYCVPNRGGLEVSVHNLEPGLPIGKQYLLVIGINNYQHWSPLQYPVKDAKEIKNILLARYHIDEVFELYDEDATKGGIFRIFSTLQDKLEIHDSLLIFYAGHGYLDDKSSTGFIIPVNGKTDVYEQANWIPNIQISGLIGKFEASHISLIFDSCFSGDLINASRGITPSINNEYFKNAYKRTSRQVLSSGSLETVPDKSVFAYNLKKALKKNMSPYVDPLMIYHEIRLSISKTTPLLGSLHNTGHQTGASHLLFLKNVPTVNIKKQSIQKQSIQKQNIEKQNIEKQNIEKNAWTFENNKKRTLIVRFGQALLLGGGVINVLAFLDKDKVESAASTYDKNKTGTREPELWSTYAQVQDKQKNKFIAAAGTYALGTIITVYGITKPKRINSVSFFPQIIKEKVFLNCVLTF